MRFAWSNEMPGVSRYPPKWYHKVAKFQKIDTIYIILMSIWWWVFDEYFETANDHLVCFCLCLCLFGTHQDRPSISAAPGRRSERQCELAQTSRSGVRVGSRFGEELGQAKWCYNVSCTRNASCPRMTWQILSEYRAFFPELPWKDAGKRREGNMDSCPP